MTIKGILVGAGLIIVGVMLGFGLSMRSNCPLKMSKNCPQAQKECFRGFEQEPRCNKGGGFGRLDFVQDQVISQLELTDDQKTKVEAIFEQKKELQKQKMKEQRTEMKAEMEKTHNEILSILDDSQKEKFNEIIKENFPRFNK